MLQLPLTVCGQPAAGPPLRLCWWYFTSYPYRNQQKILSITFLPMIKN
jgi:hypothetical protein